MPMVWSAANANVAVFSLVGSAGAVARSIVVTGGPTTVQLALAGVESTFALALASTARTSSVYVARHRGRSRSCSSGGVAHGANGSPLIEHSNVAFGLVRGEHE